MSEHLREIRSVRRALDLEGTTSEEVPIDHVGTRHRSAYRLCAQEPSAIAIVVSHDGGVQFVANRDGATTYWDEHGAGDGRVRKWRDWRAAR